MTADEGIATIGRLSPGYGAVQYGMNHEAAPALPSTPSANTTIAMTALAGRLNARPPWNMAFDMVPSLSSSSDPSADGYVHSVTIVAPSVMRVTNTIFFEVLCGYQSHRHGAPCANNMPFAWVGLA
jgi:hypothetical protein